MTHASSRDTESGMRGPRASTGGPGDSIGAWMDLLMRLLRLPEKEKRDIRGELESHLRDRTRDFMLAGLDAEESSRRAIAELGEASEVAERFRAARHEGTRRIAMYSAGIGLTVGALALAAAAWFRPAPAACPPGDVGEFGTITAVPVVEPGGYLRLKLMAPSDAARLPVALLEHGRPAEAAGLPVPRIEHGPTAESASAKAQPMPDGVGTFVQPQDEAMERLEGVTLDLSRGESVRGLIDQLTQRAKGVVRMDQLAAIGVDLDAALPATVGPCSAATAIRLLNEGLALGENGVAARVRGDGIEVATIEYFDRREIALMTVDVGDIVARRVEGGDAKHDEVVQEVRQLLMSLVNPPMWQENGGDLASISSFGATLFIQAPSRHSAKISWILGELRGKRHAAADDRDLFDDWLLSRQLLRDDVGGGGALAPARIEAPERAPLIGRLPVLSNFFTRRQDAPGVAGAGRIVVRVTPDGKVEAIGPGGTLVADELVVEARHHEPASAASIALRHTDAAGLAAALGEACGLVPSLRGEAPVADAGTNSIVIRPSDRPGRAFAIKELVRILDRPAIDAAGDAVRGVLVIEPRWISPAALRDALVALVKVGSAPKGEAFMALEVSDGRLIVHAGRDELGLIEDLARVIDADSPKDRQ